MGGGGGALGTNTSDFQHRISISTVSPAPAIVRLRLRLISLRRDHYVAVDVIFLSPNFDRISLLMAVKVLIARKH